MKTILLTAVLAAAPHLARADGMIRCSNPDNGNNGNCSAASADSASVGSGLLLIAGIAYGISRRKRR